MGIRFEILIFKHFYHLKFWDGHLFSAQRMISHVGILILLQLQLLIYHSESDFVGYLPFDVLTAGIKSGRFVQGFLQVNKSNASQEAFLRRSRYPSLLLFHCQRRLLITYVNNLYPGQEFLYDWEIN